MNIFNKSFDIKVQEQLHIREKILSSNFLGQTSGILENRANAYIQYANNQTPFIRLSSGVDIINPILKKYFNINGDDELATNFILEGGTLLSISNSNNDKILSTQRSGFNGTYGSPDLGGTSDFGYRPMPGIDSLDIKSYGDKIATLRIATITIDCYTLQQLEALELLYMRPGYRVLLEWGHTIYFENPENETPLQIRQAIDIIKIDTNKNDIFNKIEKYQQQTKYNYDGMLGKIKNFSWESQVNGTYKCTVEIISLGDIIDSLKMNVSLLKKTKGDNVDTKDPTSASNVFLNIIDEIIRNSSGGSTDVNSVTYKIDNKIYTIKRLFLNSLNESTQKSPQKLIYIRLQDLIKIINQVCIFKEGNKPSIIINEDLGTCLAHPYQISGNPYCCLISPSLIPTFTYGGSSLLNDDLTKNFKYRIDNEQFSGNIKEILIELGYVKTLFDSLIKEEKNEYNVYIKDFIQTLMENVASSNGNINDFQVVQSPLKDDEIEIIDYNYINAHINKTDQYYTIPLNGIGGYDLSIGGTYVHSYRLNTQLTNDISTTVSIAAGVDVKDGSVDGYKTSVYNAFNQGIKDRLTNIIVSSVNNSQTLNEDPLIKYENLINNTMSLLNSIDYKVSINPSSILTLKKNIQDIIIYLTTSNTNYNISFGCYTPVPLNFNITMDGISGLKVGEIFLIPKDRLPLQYKVFDESVYGVENLGKQRVGFIIFGINHNISIGKKWTTTLDCKMIMLNPGVRNGELIPLGVTKTSDKTFDDTGFRLVRELNDGVGIHLVLFRKDGITLDYKFQSLDNRNKLFGTSANNIIKSFQDDYNKNYWEGYKVKFFKNNNESYMFIGRISSVGMVVYAPQGIKTGSTLNDIREYTKASIISENHILYEIYGDELPNTYKEYSKYIDSGKAIWYHKAKKLLNGETNTEIPTINVPFVPNYNAIQPGKI